MTLPRTLKLLAAKMGYHIVRNSQNPAHTLMGLGRFDFGTVLDVGANAGQFAGEMRPRFPRATFHCFEPTPTAFDQLSQWAATQQRVIPVQRALGDQPGSLEMNVHEEHNTSSSLLPTTALCETIWPYTAAQRKVTIEVQCLDEYVAGLSTPLEDNILLKLDVQGYEIQVLRGAPSLLRRVRACICEISLDHLYEGQSRFMDILEAMNNAGLQYGGNFDQAYGADGHVIFFDALFHRIASDRAT